MSSTTIEMTRERFDMALSLIERVMPMFELNAPDNAWFKDYFNLTGQHGILTDEGWIDGEEYDQINDQYKPLIIDEVNPPNGDYRSFNLWRKEMIKRARAEGEIEMEGAVYIIAQVLSQGLHLARNGEDSGVFTYENLKNRGARLA